MGAKDTALAETRVALRNGWTLVAQRAHYGRMLAAAQMRLQAIDDATAEVDATQRHSEEP